MIKQKKREFSKILNMPEEDDAPPLLHPKRGHHTLHTPRERAKKGIVRGRYPAQCPSVLTQGQILKHF